MASSSRALPWTSSKMNMALLIPAILFLIARNADGHNKLPFSEEKAATSVIDVMKVQADQHHVSRVRRGACGAYMDSTTGEITSPSFPENYSDNTFCQWNISVSQTEQIEVSFKSLGLESCTNCTCDYVKTYSRYTNDLIWIGGPFCGTSLPDVYTSYENHLVLDFKTDNGVQGPGFSLVYKKKPCGGVYSDMEGIIESPRHPYHYPQNKKCTYEIVASPRHCISLSFTHFDLQYEPDCSGDSLQIYSTTHNGTVNNYGRSCGSRAPGNITCEGSKVRMEFASGSYGEHTGFLVEYQQVYTECAVNNGGCRHICKPNTEGNHTCTCRAGFLLHPDDHDCKEENAEGKIVQLTSLTQRDMSLMFFWKWRDGAVPRNLTGFYFKANSAFHTFQDTLPSALINFTAGQLHAYTEYEITLWPFYGEKSAPSEKLGKPITLSVRTPASTPLAPTAVTPWPQTTTQATEEVPLAIFRPLAWNSMPVGYRVRWKRSDGDESMERVITYTDFEDSALRNKNYVNITLLLEPGRTYTVSVSAYGLGDLKETLVGPETTRTFGIPPLAPVNLSTQIVDPSSAVLCWDSPSPAARYEVTVSWKNFSRGEGTTGTVSRPSFHMNSSWVVMWSTNMDARDATIRVDGSRLASSSHSLPVFGLFPCRHYEVNIRACAADACSESSMAFKTPPSSIPTPVVTTISSDSSSIHLEWSLQDTTERSDLDPQFDVRVRTNGVFRLIKTTETAITITNLSYSREYEVEVRTSLQIAPGRRSYGKPARAVVSTWPKIPLAPILSTKSFETAPDVAAVSLIFANSTIGHVEVSVNSSEFVNCKSMAACNFVMMHDWNSSFTAGFVKITEFRPYQTYILGFRGCSDNGCGDASTVLLTTGISVPSEPLNLRISTVDNVTADLDWEPPEEPAGPLTGYLISWECDKGVSMAATTTECFFAIPGHTSSQNCSVSVSAYNVADNGEELYGKPATLTTQAPLPVPTTAYPHLAWGKVL